MTTVLNLIKKTHTPRFPVKPTCARKSPSIDQRRLLAFLSEQLDRQQASLVIALLVKELGPRSMDGWSRSGAAQRRPAKAGRAAR